MSAITLDDLDDFIHPSSTCIKPVKRPELVGGVSKRLDINLGDCLACSGCITSAESILVEQQNHEELFKFINDNKVAPQEDRKEIVVSLSLQSIASLAAKHGLSMQETAERLCSLLVSLGCNKVYDINMARHISLLESVKEFVHKYKVRKAPVLNSVCPGWVCYVEKTHGELLIPKLSCVKSPQQIMGLLVKRLSKFRGDKIYHVTIMPCFDKKLEASREEFEEGTNKYKYVDLVLTPIELENIMEAEGVTLVDLCRRRLDLLPFPGNISTEMSLLTSHSGSSSGGYAENILTCSALILFPDQFTDKNNPQIRYTTGRNKDFVELEISIPGEKPLLKFAIVNGFRNIQTLVQRIKRNVLDYDYVEIMACPSGCINGGAQCKPSFDSVISRGEEFLQTVRNLYQSVRQLKVDPKETEDLYKDLEMSDTSVQQLLYTSFHPVPKTQNILVNW